MNSFQGEPKACLTRRGFHRLVIGAGASFLSPGLGIAAELGNSPFVHPGVLHTAPDLERMRHGVRDQKLPIIAGFWKLREHPFSRPDYRSHPFSEEIGRNPSVNFPAFDNDANAAYQCSLMAAITGDRRYITLARNIVLGWSGSLQRVSGADAVLMAGLGPFKFINAAEILRGIGQLNTAEVVMCAAMLQRAILPVLVDFAPFANGNWDTAAIKTMLAIAVFCDDRALFERAVLYYLYGDGDGQLTHYIDDNGQCQESGRDQQHTQLGLAHMGDACEIAWHQGLDLYGAENNRLLKGFEYTAAYNLGKDVKFHPDVDRTGKYRHSVISPRGAFRPVYEQILAHYHGRRGLPAPKVALVVKKIRPEGAAQGADHAGFGTLLYATEGQGVQRDVQFVVPGPVHAAWKKGAVELEWLLPHENHVCWIERAGEKAAFHRIKAESTEGHLCDKNVHLGKQYRYRVAARESSVQMQFSGAVPIFTGLPVGWHHGPLGHPSFVGDVQYDGAMLTVDTAGGGLMNPQDEGHFVAVSQDCTALSARFVPQTASQSVMFGLMQRLGFAVDANCVALLLVPAHGDQERHGWRIRLLSRDGQNKVRMISDHALGESVGSYGRLERPVWFRMQLMGAVIAAQYSLDGAMWNDAGQTVGFDGGLLGFGVSSGIGGVDSVVRFDSLVLRTN